jgi:hypothetical protein
MLLPAQSAAELALDEAGAAAAGPVSTAAAEMASEAATARLLVALPRARVLPKRMSLIKASSLK